MDLSAVVLGEGDQTGAHGRVVAYEGQVWFEPPLPIPAVLHAPGHEPPPRPSGLGVLARGVDIGELGDRREKDGGVEGWATLSGVWRSELLDVSAQEPLPLLGLGAQAPWDSSPHGDAVDVVPRRWSRSELEAVSADLSRHRTEWLIYISGESATEAGLVFLEVELVRVVPTMAQWARSVPDGLLDVRAWLRPDRS